MELWRPEVEGQVISGMVRDRDVQPVAAEQPDGAHVTTWKQTRGEHVTAKFMMLQAYMQVYTYMQTSFPYGHMNIETE